MTIKFGELGLSLSPEVGRALLAFTSEAQDVKGRRLSVGINFGEVCATDGMGAVRFVGGEVDMGSSGLTPMTYTNRHWLRQYVADQLKAAGRYGVVELAWLALDPDPYFPKLSEAEPRVEPKALAHPIGVSTELLARLELVARACRRDRIGGASDAPPLPTAILTSIAGPLDPMRFQIGGAEQTIESKHVAYVTLMPMRLGFGVAAPRARRKPKARKAGRKEVAA